MKRALLSPRAWLLSLLALALILGPLAPFLTPPPASADHITVWSATLTVQTLVIGTGVGCASSETNAAGKCSNPATLTEDEFTYLGVDYRIASFTHQGVQGGRYAIGFSRSIDAAADEFKKLTLHVDNVPVSLADADIVATLINPSTSSVASVPVPSAGDTVQLKLTLPGPGDLDDTFGIGGKLTTAFNPAASEIHDVVEQPDGKIVAVGYAQNGSSRDFALARYNPDGSLDGTFGTGGRVLTDFNSNNDEARSVALQSDGKIVVGGYSFQSNRDFAAARYTSTGTLDTAFSTDGKVTHNFGANDDANDVVIQTVGGTERILLAGQAGTSFGLVRFTSAGVLDTGFGTINQGTRTGSTAFDFSTLEDGATAVAIQSDNKIVVAGFTTNNNGTPASTDDDHKDFAVRRMSAVGDPDNAFDTDSNVTTDIGSSAGGTSNVAGTQDRANAITIQSNGKIVVAGYSKHGTNPDDFAVVRYNTGGALDGEFGTITTDPARSGKHLVNINGEDKAHAVAVDSGGKFLLAGYTDITSGTDETNDDFALTRLDANGTEDFTFGTELPGGASRTGTVPLDFAKGDDRAHTMALLGGGTRIMLAGYATSGSTKEFALARYTALGELDLSFGIGGRVTTSFAAPDAYGNAMAVQTDGKIVVAGYVENDNGTTATTDDHDDFTVARYNPDGSLDTAFGNGGRVSTDIGTGSDDQANAVAIDSSGNIVVAGQSSSDGVGDNRDFAVVRYTSAGALDTAFSTDGKVTTNFNSKSDIAYAVAIDSSGNIVVGGVANNSSDREHFALARYTSAGALDTNFGTGGKVTEAFAGANASIHALALQSDNKIVVAGAAHNGTGGLTGGLDFAVARYTSAGALDTTFSTDGKVTTSIGNGYDRARAVAIDGDGNIVVAGEAHVTGSSWDFALARYTSAGELDTSFGTGGKVTTAIGSDNDQANAVAIDGNGRIVLAGYATEGSGFQFALVRYRSNGSLDTGFGAGGVVTTDCFVGTQASANAMALDSGSRIVTAGYSFNDGFREIALARYLGGGESPAALSALAVSTSIDGFTFDGTATLSPAFASGTTSYTTTLPSGVNRIKVTPTVAESGATVTVNSATTASGTASAAIAVTAGGTTTVNVVVTAQDGATTETYTITVTVLSNDATLSALTVSTSTDGSTFSGTAALSPAFASGRTSYSSSVIEGVTHVKVTPTVSHSDATVTVNGVATASGSASSAFTVTEGATTTITLVVTAQDNQVTTTYTVAVNFGEVATIAISPSTVDEGDSAQITVTITEAQSGAISIPITTTAVSAESGDYSAPSSIRIAAGATTGTGTLQTRHDPDAQDETLTVALGSNLPADLKAGSPSSVTVTIDDDEYVSTVQVQRTTPNPVAEGETVSVILGISPAKPNRLVIPVTLTHGTSESGDFSSLTSITIEAGQSIGIGQIRTNHDPDLQDETFTVALGTNLPALTTAGAPNSETITIDDDEYMSFVAIDAVLPDPAVEGETMYIRLAIEPAQPNRMVIPLTFAHQTSEAGDFTTLSSITIEAHQPQAVGQIRANQDSDQDDETFTVALGSNLPPLLSAGSPSSTIASIEDDDDVVAPKQAPFQLPLRRGDSSLTVIWGYREDHSPYTSVDIEYRVKGTTSWTSINTGPELDEDPRSNPRASHTITGLTNGTTYQVRVRARNSEGAGPWSRGVEEAAPAAPPAAPTGLAAETQYRSLIISWTAPSNDVTSYHLRYKESSSSTWLQRNMPGTDEWRDIYGTQHRVSGLTSGTAYDVQVRARIDDSTGAWSATATGTAR